VASETSTLRKGVKEGGGDTGTEGGEGAGLRDVV